MTTHLYSVPRLGASGNTSYASWEEESSVRNLHRKRVNGQSKTTTKCGFARL